MSSQAMRHPELLLFAAVVIGVAILFEYRSRVERGGLAVFHYMLGLYFGAGLFLEHLFIFRYSLFGIELIGNIGSILLYPAVFLISTCVYHRNVYWKQTKERQIQPFLWSVLRFTLQTALFIVTLAPFASYQEWNPALDQVLTVKSAMVLIGGYILFLGEFWLSSRIFATLRNWNLWLRTFVSLSPPLMLDAAVYPPMLNFGVGVEYVPSMLGQLLLSQVVILLYSILYALYMRYGDKQRADFNWSYVGPDSDPLSLKRTSAYLRSMVKRIAVEIKSSPSTLLVLVRAVRRRAKPPEVLKIDANSPSAPRPVAEFACFVDRIQNELAYVTLESEPGVRFHCVYETARLAASGIGENSFFKVQIFEADGKQDQMRIALTAVRTPPPTHEERSARQADIAKIFQPDL